MDKLDALLNRYTMYRVVLYSLICLLAVSLVFALTGTIAISPIGLCLSITVLVATTYVTNRLFSWLLRVPANTESWLITALILVCILPPAASPSRCLLIGLAGVIAMVSKYVLVWRGSNLFNPAAVAAVVVGVSGLLPATWWIASPPMAVFTALIALLVLRKLRRFDLFVSFASASLLMMLLVGSVLQDQSAALVIKNAFLSWPLIFMGSIMLTEPSTLPIRHVDQTLYGMLVGTIFTSQLHAGVVAATPESALIVGNIFTICLGGRVSMLLKFKYKVQLSPTAYDFAFELPQKRRLNFMPGQYLEWTLPHAKVDGRGNRRTFSIASSPTEKLVHVGIKHYEPSSSFKTALLALKPGNSIRAAHLGGTFVLPKDERRPLVFIAGGIGITPFRSMLKYLVDMRQSRDVTLFYLARDDLEFAYKETLREAADVGLTTHYITGRVAELSLQATIKEAAMPLFYVSGPGAMVQYYQKLLQHLHVPRGHIRTDHFTGY